MSLIQVKDIKVGTSVLKDGIIYKVTGFNIITPFPPLGQPPLREIWCSEVDSFQYFSWNDYYDSYVNIYDGIIDRDALNIKEPDTD